MLKHSEHSLWLIVVSAFIGGLFGSVFRPDERDSLTPPSIRQNAIDSQEFDTVLEEIKDLRKMLDSHDQAIGLQISLIGNGRKETEPSKGETSGFSAGGLRMEPSSGSWPNVLPPIIGKELVVRGLSPFDGSHIAVLTQKVCLGFDELERNRRKGNERLLVQYSSGQLDGNQCKELQREIQDDYHEKVELLISEFVENLDELTKAGEDV